MAILAYALLAVGALAVLQGGFALWNGASFRRYVRQELSRPLSSYAPPAAVFLPCKGLDSRLEATLSSLIRQDYPAYEVICAVESMEDPARGIIEQCAGQSSGIRIRCVAAPRAEVCSQKIANLLTAIGKAGPETKVFAFLDSDAVPAEDWLASLVEPLSDPGVGASTGYRWYVPTGGLPSLLRCVWNASTLTFLGDHGRNFCWGGSTAIRRETFERLGIAERWRGVLSDDYELTRSVRSAGMRVRFTPRCVLPSDEPATWTTLWQFARRQMIITRVCSPKVWAAGAAMGLVFNASIWGLLMLGLLGSSPFPTVAWSMLGLIYGLAVGNGTMRQLAVARIFPDRRQRRWAGWADALGAPLVGIFNLALIAASARQRRFLWRGILYDVQAQDRVTVVRRTA